MSLDAQLDTHLEDLEDAELATAAYEEYLKDGCESSSLEDVRLRLGL